MATRRCASIRNHLDSSNPANWTSAELKVELEKIGIKINENLSNKQLRRIYLDNKKNSSDNVGSGAEQVDAAQTNDASVNSSGLVTDTETIRDNLQPPINSSLTNINLDTDSTSARMNLHGTTPSTSAHGHSAFPPSSNQNNNIECSLLSNTIALCQQALAGVSGQTDKFNLHTAMNACQQQTTSFPLHYQQRSPMLGKFGSGAFRHSVPLFSTLNQQQTKFGYPAAVFSGVDMVSPEIRSKIIAGKDINLNILLLPSYETPSKQKNKDNDDRLKRNLALDEFITAFGRYKKIMCSAFPNRAEELDAYLAHIVETARVWPQKFYEYHKMFSSKCAIMLQEHNIKLDWSLGDPDLRQLVCAGSRVNMCNLCSSTLHSASMCPNINSRSNQSQYSRGPSSTQLLDRYGRDVMFYDGVQICNNFNQPKGCSKPYCRYSHICKLCKLHGHGKFQCSGTRHMQNNKQAESHGSKDGSKQPYAKTK